MVYLSNTVGGGEGGRRICVFFVPLLFFSFTIFSLHTVRKVLLPPSCPLQHSPPYLIASIHFSTSIYHRKSKRYRAGGVDLVELLLERGCSIDAPTVPEAWTPLMLCAMESDPGAACLFLDKGASLIAVDKKGISVQAHAGSQRKFQSLFFMFSFSERVAAGDMFNARRRFLENPEGCLKTADGSSMLRRVCSYHCAWAFKLLTDYKPLEQHEGVTPEALLWDLVSAGADDAEDRRSPEGYDGETPL
jgi:hypothetical protein